MFVWEMMNVNKLNATLQGILVRFIAPESTSDVSERDIDPLGFCSVSRRLGSCMSHAITLAHEEVIIGSPCSVHQAGSMGTLFNITSPVVLKPSLAKNQPMKCFFLSPTATHRHADRQPQRENEREGEEIIWFVKRWRWSIFTIYTFLCIITSAKEGLYSLFICWLTVSRILKKLQLDYHARWRVK